MIYTYKYIYTFKLYKQLISVILLTLIFIFPDIVFSQQITITQPADGQIFTTPSSVNIIADVSGVQTPEPSYIQVNHNLTGYRKLKIGNNPDKLFSPAINLLEGNNDKVEITLRDFNGNCNWSKIRFRPQATGTLSLGTYVSAVGGVGNEWKKITIPLADFGPAVNFSQVAFIEFPYSSDAGPFNIGFSEIKFTGGTTPYLWFGEEKSNIIHDGATVGAGGLPAVLVPSTSGGIFAEIVEFFLNGEKIGEDGSFPFTFNLNDLQAGNYHISTRMQLNDGTSINSASIAFTMEDPPQSSLSIQIVQPADSLIVEPDYPVNIETSVEGAYPAEPTYLLVMNQMTGYRKLKLGYNPTNIYSPLNDVINSGNNSIEITLKAIDSQVNWTRIQLRPSSLGSLSVNNYVLAAGASVNEWFTITIPLSDFNTAIDFTNLAYMEFPYSASAGNFQIAIKSIKFIGGYSPFIWFGEGKTDNSHDGNGGTSQLIASLVNGNSSEENIDRVEFFVDGQKVYEDFSYPYSYQWSQSAQGTYSIYARVNTLSSLFAESEAITVTVFSEIPEESPLGIDMLQPSDSLVVYAPATLTLESTITGVSEVTFPYLEVSNTETGYRKLKLGYTPGNIYGPTQNVVASGNNILEITMINLGEPVNWSKIKIRPLSIGSLSLADYISAAGGIDNVWKTISIPLADFDPSIDFSKINYFEFPYSSDAGNFKLGISLIKFTGGTAPFTWFGEGKYDNPHNGDGGTSSLIANLIMPPTNPVTVSKVLFYKNGDSICEFLQPPYSYLIQNLNEGEYYFYSKLIDSNGSFSLSDSVYVKILPNIPEGAIVLNITFDNPPSNLSVSKAPLRYNKDFAYSFSLDDTYRDAYTHAYTLLHGGFLPDNNTTYPGLFYTDGCGNDKPFTGALMWISVNSNYSDIHINTPGYLTWGHLTEMVSNGWNVINHTYSHAYGTGTDYAFQINKNVEYVFEKTGLTLKHFTTPSGDNNYVPVAFANGMKSVTQNNSSYQGFPNGLKVDAPLNFNQFKLYRRFIYDGICNVSNASQYIDNASNLSTNGNHYWYSDFTHRVGFQQISGSLVFPTLEYYMNYIAATYGKYGSDRVWMAGYQDVYEYLAVRDYSVLHWNLNGNQLQIIIDPSNIPDDLDKYALSLVIDANANIIQINNETGIELTWNNSSKKLINLDWTGSNFKNGLIGDEMNKTSSTPSNISSLIISPNPVKESLNLQLAEGIQLIRVSIFDAFGKSILSENINESGNFSNLQVANLKSGIYIVSCFSSDGQVFSQKFIKE